jgi:hypothetical protein
MARAAHARPSDTALADGWAAGRIPIYDGRCALLFRVLSTVRQKAHS